MLSALLDLTLALQANLTANLPALVDEVNAAKLPDIPIVMPTAIDLGIRTEMLDRELDELPAMSCGINLRQVEDSGEQDYSYILMPFSIDIYLGDEDPTNLYIRAMKWGLVLDAWVERYSYHVLDGIVGDEAPDLDITYVLEDKRRKNYRQLVTATGVFSTYE